MHSKLEHPKRGYLANLLTIPPLIYPFQYNPTELTDSKSIKWGKKKPIPPAKVGQSWAALGAGNLGAIAGAYTGSKELLGRTFSSASLHRFESEGDRTVSFKFVLDGRQKRPGEPARRRNEEGHILGDLSILRSFVYPRIAELTDLLAAAFGSGESRWVDFWFQEPPTATLILGSMSLEGFITQLKITEKLFNAELDPVRAEVEVTMIEKVDSISFIIDSIKRTSRTFYHTAYEDVGKVLF